MKLAYADPPYLGQGRKHYAQHHDDAAEWDSIYAHLALIQRLEDDYDGWALSASSSSLQELLACCQPGVRIAAWVKPFAAFKVGVNPAYAWEPVIFRPTPRKHDRSRPTTRDWLAASITLKKGLTGAKPTAFCRWIFDLIRAEPDDKLDDLFPGTGIVGREWDKWRNQMELAA